SGWPAIVTRSVGRRRAMSCLPPTDAIRAGFDPERLARVGALVAAGGGQGLYLGAAYQVLCGGGVVANSAAGRGAPGCACTVQTVFGLASLTKPIVTATSILILAERGELHLGEEVTRFLGPDAAPLAGITLRHLLTHTSGLPAWAQYHSRDLAPETIRA